MREGHSSPAAALDAFSGQWTTKRVERRRDPRSRLQESQLLTDRAQRRYNVLGLVLDLRMREPQRHQAGCGMGLVAHAVAGRA
jgi:hypothetical protein